MNAAMTFVEAVAKSFATVKFHENYLDRHGSLSWENYKAQLDKANQVVSIRAHICL